MSHFIVAVITKNPNNYQEELAPYQENNMCDCPKEFLEFVDKTEEYTKEWQEESVEKVKLPGGTYISAYDDRLKHYITKEEYEALDKNVRKGSEGWRENERFYFYDASQVNGTLVSVPYREIYKTLDDYVKNEWGEHEWDNEMKAYGYWDNPNAKWDSYGLCRAGTFGRWQDSPIEDAFVKVKDYQLYKPKQELIDEYNKELEEVETGKAPKILFQLNYGNYKDAEDYAEKERVQAPWAFVLDKHWAERGKMGWWAMNDATEESEDAFRKLFEKIMTDPKYQDYYIGFVNCHI